MDLMTDGQIIVMLLCAALAYIAYKTKQPAISLVAGVGLFVLAVQLYDSSSPDLLLLAMMVSVAIIQFVLVVSHSGRRH